MLKLILACIAAALLSSSEGSKASWRQIRDLQDRLAEFVPSVISNAPPAIFEVIFGNKTITPGTEVSPCEAATPPTVIYNFESDCYYTIIICDLDSPSPANPAWRCFLLYLTVNVQVGVVVSDEPTPLCPVRYYGPNPAPGTGRHRYIALLYKQNGYISDTIDQYELQRQGFSIPNFTATYDLWGPIAGNLFTSEYPNCNNSTGTA